MTKCKCVDKQSTDRQQMNGLRDNIPRQQQYGNFMTPPQKTINKMSVSVGLAKCPSPHPSIKGTRSLSGVAASTSKISTSFDGGQPHRQSKEQLNSTVGGGGGSFRRKLNNERSVFSSESPPNEDDDHIANGHHISILGSDDNDDDDNNTEYESDDNSDSDNNLENYLKITVPSDCRLKQSITPTNSPQSMQHSPHHAISVLSSILAKYETSGYLERRKRNDQIIWNRQINSERTSPRIMRSSIIAANNLTGGDGDNSATKCDMKHSRRSNCYFCVQTSSASKSTKKNYHQHSVQSSSNHYMANLKSRTLSLPQCSFTDFDNTPPPSSNNTTVTNNTTTAMLATMCSDLNCRCIHVQSTNNAIKTGTKKYDRSNKINSTDMCNCSTLKLSTNGSDVLETTC